ncbi:MAG: MBOAT family protein [bacterium]|nr:MBOAT family protein [bacterium]
MRFTTLSFLLFFAILYLAYWAASGRLRLHLILIGSIIFYAAWSIPFALHFFGIVGLNYGFVRLMFRAKAKAGDGESPGQSGLAGKWMGLAIALNIANLFLFKYFYLFLTILFDLTGSPIFQHKIFNEWLYATTGNNAIILPLAISFYTFQLIAYVVDVHRGQIAEDTGPLKFFVFILFFPQLVAGPIMRHSDFFHQLNAIRPNEEYIRRGLYLLLTGLIKKVVIADNCIAPVQAVFAAPGEYDAVSNLAAIFGFAARVYCDFSGYTDVARGLGYLLGLKLPENFRAPYMSDSARDLWQRWHITLATWLRDYIYIPMGGNRRGYWRSHLNLITTFTLGGLWHGANYTYIVWGFMHGIALSVERVYGDVRAKLNPESAASAAPEENPSGLRRMLAGLGRGTRMLIVFLIFCAGIIPFNSPDIYSAWEMTLQLFNFSGEGMRSKSNDFLLSMLAVTMLFNYIQFRREWRLPSPRTQYALLFVLGFITMALIGRFAPGGFDYIYFQF